MPTAYVVKTVVEGQPFPGVFGELKAGRARIGWSYEDYLDLRLPVSRIEQGKQLSKHERFSPFREVIPLTASCEKDGIPIHRNDQLSSGRT